jgi:hypothetical protein
MPLPPLLHLPDAKAYHAYFQAEYVARSPVITYDGIQVRFFANQFTHAFFRDSTRGANDKAVFDWDRAKRMVWIRPVLSDPSLDVRRRTMDDGQTRRVVLHPRARYVVVVQLYDDNPLRAVFITAFWIRDPNSSSLGKIQSNPPW